MINTAVAVNAAHKMRFAQDLALFNLDLAEASEAFDGSAHRAVWQEAPEWQPVREVVEQLTAVGDWCQLLVATNMELTEAEAKNFWPVCDEYQKELQKINQRLHALLTSYAAD
jgi:hypothetical protein